MSVSHLPTATKRKWLFASFCIAWLTILSAALPVDMWGWWGVPSFEFLYHVWMAGLVAGAASFIIWILAYVAYEDHLRRNGHIWLLAALFPFLAVGYLWGGDYVFDTYTNLYTSKPDSYGPLNISLNAVRWALVPATPFVLIGMWSYLRQWINGTAKT